MPCNFFSALITDWLCVHAYLVLVSRLHLINIRPDCHGQLLILWFIIFYLNMAGNLLPSFRNFPSLFVRRLLLKCRTTYSDSRSSQVQLVKQNVIVGSLLLPLDCSWRCFCLLSVLLIRRLPHDICKVVHFSFVQVHVIYCGALYYLVKFAYQCLIKLQVELRYLLFNSFSWDILVLLKLI